MLDLTHVSILETGVRDGLGDRLVGFDRASGGTLQILRVRPELAAFGATLDEVVNRLVDLSDRHLVTPRGVARDGSSPRPLVVSEHVEGERLNDLLVRAHARSVVPDVTVALYLANQVLAALAALERAAQVAHGALSLGRVIVAPRGRIVLAEHMFGPLLEQLEFSHGRLWRELGVAMPEEPVPALCDYRSDVAQVAVMTLALVLGRPLQEDEYPAGLEGLLNEVREIAWIRGGDTLANAVGSWLDLALPLPGRLIFDSAAQARGALGSMLPPEPGSTGTRADLQAFLKQVAEAEELEAPVESTEASAASEAAREPLEVIAGEDALEAEDDGPEPAAERADVESDEPGAGLTERAAASPAGEVLDETLDLVIEEEASSASEDEASEPRLIELSEDVLKELSAFGINLPAIPASKKRREEPAEAVAPAVEEVAPPQPDAEAIAAATAAFSAAYDQAPQAAPAAELFDAVAQVRAPDPLSGPGEAIAEPPAPEIESIFSAPPSAVESEPIFEVAREAAAAVAAARLEEPAVEEPVAEAQVIEAPVAEAPIVEAPVAEAQVFEAPMAEAPVVVEPVAEAPVAAEEAALEELIAEVVAASELAAGGVTSNEPLAEAGLIVAEEPVVAQESIVAEEAKPVVEAAPPPTAVVHEVMTAAIQTPVEEPVVEAVDVEEEQPAGIASAVAARPVPAESAEPAASKKSRKKRKRRRKGATQEEAEVAPFAARAPEPKVVPAPAPAPAPVVTTKPRPIEPEPAPPPAVVPPRRLIELEPAAFASALEPPARNEWPEFVVPPPTTVAAPPAPSSSEAAPSPPRMRLIDDTEGPTVKDWLVADDTPPPPPPPHALSPEAGGHVGADRTQAEHAVAARPAAQPSPPRVPPHQTPVTMPSIVSEIEAGGTPVSPEDALKTRVRAQIDKALTHAKQMAATPSELEDDMPQAAPRSGFRWMRAAAAIAVLAGGAVFAGSQWLGARARPGTVVIETTPADSEVFVDGSKSGTTPLTMKLAPGEHTVELRRKGRSQTITLSVEAGAQIARNVEWAAVAATGSLAVTSEPAGAKVLVDGRAAGETPLTVPDLTVGRHKVVLEAQAGSVTRTVQIRADQVTKLDMPIFSGWLAIFAPVELQIFEGGRLLGTTTDGRIMVPPGVHSIQLVNDSFQYRASETVEVKPGEVKALSYEPKGMVNLNATPWAEVFVDGERIGETPLANVPVTIGTREFVFRHPDYGERRVTATVTLGEVVRVNVDMAKQ